MSVHNLILTARELGAKQERAEIRDIIDVSSFGIAALEVFGDDPIASRAVASYSRLILQVLDEREAAGSSSTTVTSDTGTVTTITRPSKG